MASRGTPEQAGAGWGKQGYVGAGCGKLGQVGPSLNLHNAAIVFFFVAYVFCGTNCVNHTDVRNEQEGKG